MILTCTECDTSFNFDERLVKASGSKVRCSKCHSVFTAFPQSESEAASAGDAGSAAAATAAAAGLDDLDLDEIEKSLDLDIDTAGQQPGGAGSDNDEIDFDLGLEGDVAGSPAAGDTQFQETQELDLSDFDLDEATDSTETSAGADDDLSFDLDLDEDDSPAAIEDDLTPSDTLTEEVPDLDFDLGLDLEAADEPDSAAAPAGEDLDFSLDLDMDEEPAAADAAPSDADLMDETRAMEPGELDDLLSGAEASADESELIEETEALDLDLDLDLEADAQMEGDVEESTEELDFDLGLDDEADSAAGGEAAPVLEETEELDLADLEGMIDADEDAADSDVPMEETEELDLSGLEDALELEEPSGSSIDESTEELDLDLDFDSDGAEPDVADDLEEDDEGDFDLTDLDDMLEMDDGGEDEPADSAAEDDFDLELDVDGEADDADMEYGFDVEEDEAASAGAQQQGEEMADSFDMGTIAELDETVDDAYLDDDEMDYAAAKPPKKGGRGISRPFKVLLVLVLLLGGGYGAVTLLNFFGIEVPYLDAVKEIEIPYVSDLLGPKDAGNLNIAILENRLRGKFVENSKLGTLYVVRGRVKNNYKHPRSYISLTGKLYTKGGKLNQTKTVYAGNMFSDKRLAIVNQTQLTRRQNNRNGSKRSNLNVPRGKVRPFMIVFWDLPPNPDEYSVEVAASVKAK